jgi:hypothetical protein
VLQRETATDLDITAVSFWKYLTRAVGPALIDALAPNVAGNDEEPPSVIVRIELAAGVASAGGRRPRAPTQSRASSHRSCSGSPTTGRRRSGTRSPVAST